MRTEGASLACVELDPTERDWFDLIKQTSGEISDANVLRMGLWHYGKHLDVPITARTFRLRHPTVREQPLSVAERALEYLAVLFQFGASQEACEAVLAEIEARQQQKVSA